MFKRTAFLITIFFLQSLCLLAVTDSTLLNSDQQVYVRQIIFTGNKVTRPHIMQRELLVQAGDVMTMQELDKRIERSRENLLNTSLFNFVEIKQQFTGSTDVYLIIEVVERWYVFPVPIFEIVDRNFYDWWQDKNLSKTNYGFYLNWENFRGRRENIKALVRFGYSVRQGFQYSVPYMDKKQNDGIVITAIQTFLHEIPYQLSDNRLLYYKSDDIFSRKEYKANIRYTHRQGINKTFALTLGFQSNIISDTILKLNNNYFNNGFKTENYPSFTFEYKDDARDIRNYPLSGYFLSMEFTKLGVGINSTDPSLTNIILHGKKFWKLNKRWSTAASAKFKLSGINDVPFYNQQALGYEGDVIRGYDRYVINGENFALFKTGIKYNIIKPRAIHLPVGLPESFTKIPYSLYANLFFDAGYVRDKRFYYGNPLSNSWQYSFGAGLDFVTYYDMVIRAEFAVNKLGNTGFYFHLTAPI
ncbi:MAG: hypothetical protein JSS90_06455 [Bacteroidetes bacterium]|nr:hypothetical protein [Bacteroidota bacterium]